MRHHLVSDLLIRVILPPYVEDDKADLCIVGPSSEQTENKSFQMGGCIKHQIYNLLLLVF